jgi:hypothetical protein
VADLDDGIERASACSTLTAPALPSERPATAWSDSALDLWTSERRCPQASEPGIGLLVPDSY